MYLFGYRYLGDVTPIGMKFCTMVDLGPGQVFCPWGSPKAPKIPNFEREYI